MANPSTPSNYPYENPVKPDRTHDDVCKIWSKGSSPDFSKFVLPEGAYFLGFLVKMAQWP